MLKRRGSAVWKGGLQDGTGIISSFSGVLNNTPYSFKTRLVSEDGKAGTNPEELLAAAHAGCFGMAVSAVLGQAGFTADELSVNATLTLETDGVPKITAVDLQITGKVPGISQEQFEKIASDASKTCIISQALNPNINVTKVATLEAY
ncbi:OsmC family peroxiredoxin [Spirosoma endbachense]|uniref:OsmC family peroxiredoxin n=1 Tax=Spirosoma endbachense TaxID=2666025 RepID=A0A6P1VS68_9BACT|nr:OsmC family peroxiredoxin [Spirosoma endbachense]QHV95923.1 OsmC family peroxiredoxin [Spirosoma endbachense]